MFIVFILCYWNYILRIRMSIITCVPRVAWSPIHCCNLFLSRSKGATMRRKFLVLPSVKFNPETRNRQTVATHVYECTVTFLIYLLLKQLLGNYWAIKPQLRAILCHSCVEAEQNDLMAASLSCFGEKVLTIQESLHAITAQLQQLQL